MKSLTLKVDPKPISPKVLFVEEYREVVKHLRIQLQDANYLIITDESVHRHSTAFFDYFEADKVVTLPAGENIKQWDSVKHMLDQCFQHHLDRNSYLIAVGGGVITDAVGFAASIFLRGINFVQIPTSLLCMVDAALGGKTGMNCEWGKNLIGSFHHPKLILMARDFLQTLPEKEIQNGLSEMIKHGVITSKKHFTDLESLATPHPKTVLNDIWKLVPDSIQIKKQVVESDPFEGRERMKLNLGHTFGHALERLTDMRMPHGQAVAIGTIIAADYAVKKGLCSQTTANRIRKIFVNFGMDLEHKFTFEQIWKAMGTDKKREGDYINLILPRSIGEVDIVKEKYVK